MPPLALPSFLASGILKSQSLPPGTGKRGQRTARRAVLTRFHAGFFFLSAALNTPIHHGNATNRCARAQGRCAGTTLRCPHATGRCGGTTSRCGRTTSRCLRTTGRCGHTTMRCAGATGLHLWCFWRVPVVNNPAKASSNQRQTSVFIRAFPLMMQRSPSRLRVKPEPRN